ncbi:hypothetical protein O1O06_11895 [Grimontia hollisae]|uniref:hypothetical protein n=1 Tax=Grimontia hollisae TaxID=673 RepID=UPI0023DA2BCE|nr:hypothetical protein [Grimontia hollisae]MDF2185465.1 hypothetical protein [Grimontia hollisae]
MTTARFMPLSPALNRRLVDLGFVVLGGVAVWFVTRQLARKVADSVNDTVRDATAPAGSLLADITQWYHGSFDVELRPLMIRDFYLTDDYRLTPLAEETLWNWEPWHPALKQLFGGRGGVMLAKYRPLINQEINLNA